MYTPGVDGQDLVLRHKAGEAHSANRVTKIQGSFSIIGKKMSRKGRLHRYKIFNMCFSALLFPYTKNVNAKPEHLH